MGWARSHIPSTAPTPPHPCPNRPQGRHQGAPDTSASPQWAKVLSARETQRPPPAGPYAGGSGPPPAGSAAPTTYSMNLLASLPPTSPAELPRLPGNLPGPQAGPGIFLGLPQLAGALSQCQSLFPSPGQCTVSLRAGMGLGHPGPQNGHWGSGFQVNESGSWEPHATFLGHWWTSCSLHPLA